VGFGEVRRRFGTTIPRDTIQRITLARPSNKRNQVDHDAIASL